MKVRIGDTLGYIEDEVLINQFKNNKKTAGIKKFIEERQIRCGYCKEKIVCPDYLVVIFNPKEPQNPPRLYFFCYEKKCAQRWGEARSNR